MSKQLTIQYGKILAKAQIKRASPEDRVYAWKGRRVSCAWQGYSLDTEDVEKRFVAKYGYKPLKQKRSGSSILAGPIFEPE